MMPEVAQLPFTLVTPRRAPRKRPQREPEWVDTVTLECRTSKARENTEARTDDDRRIEIAIKL